MCRLDTFKFQYASLNILVECCHHLRTFIPIGLDHGEDNRVYMHNRAGGTVAH
jgi:hypothetical protein